MSEPKLKRSIAVANGLGECILWDELRQHVLWTDIPGKTLYIHNAAVGTTRELNFDEDLCSFALIEGSDDLLCAFRSGFSILNRQNEKRRWLHRNVSGSKTRLNDGRVDRQGRFWCGSMNDNGRTDDLSGELYRVDENGGISKHLDGIGVSNSLCWSPDGATMYFGDTLRKVIWAFDYDCEVGTIRNQRVFTRTPEPCGPDGSTVDAEGFLWNAEWGRGRIVRYAADGTLDLVLQLPVSHVTCLCFGGDDLSDLYVTTAIHGLSEEQLRGEPGAGNVFVFETSFHGLPENRFRNRIPKSVNGR